MITYDICKLNTNKNTHDDTIFLIGNGNKEFSLSVAQCFKNVYYSCDISKCVPTMFANSEIQISSITENIRQRNVVIIQSMIDTVVYTNEGERLYSVNDLFMELCILIDTVKRGSAKSVTVVMPIFPYQRQDRKDSSRRPISARMITTILESLNISRVIVFDLHAAQIQGFFGSTPLDNLFSEPFFIKYIIDTYKDKLDSIVIVSPDEGGLKRAVRISNKLKCNSAFIYKERNGNGAIENMIILGEVKDKICIIVDDIIDTASTACKAASILKENGANDIIMCACHGILSKNAIKKIEESLFSKVIVSNTVISQLRLNQLLEHYQVTDNKIEIIDVSSMCAVSIERCLNGESLKQLLDIKVD